MHIDQQPARFSDATATNALRFTWLNFQSGGARTSGKLDYDFTRLHRLAAPLVEPQLSPAASMPVAIFALCEAKGWAADANHGLLAASDVLSATLGRPYAAKMLPFDRGPIGPALFYDPTLVAPVAWHGGGYPDFDDKAGVIRFRTVHTDQHLVVIVRHWNPRSPQIRLEEARLLGSYGDGFPDPVFVMGDLNATATGSHWPRRDWTKAPYIARDAKAIRMPDGAWVDATDAIHHLIGEWEWDEFGKQGRRTDGCGFWAMPEVAYATGTPAGEAFMATVNRDIDAGGGQIIDHCLVTRPQLYVPGTYRVHVPTEQHDGRWDSDHRLVEATFSLASSPVAWPHVDAGLATRYRLHAVAATGNQPPDRPRT
ncbi:endonuclease/exonuclease/phosphatase family protein [Actinoplanes sp. NBRC 103695]|uniref:endonuclease/exonuclease/phosphatase family protein n=1 Tax=Actinoplanes sp. NBRC 103695 TaxID=3032202 RepID=UPI0025570FDD|nr:endonuclease/exonuclease/phosphatase family protein [Actinoplanes sp. NBRC 103695]